MPCVHVLRTPHGAQCLRADLLAGGHVVVVGAGFIGAEVASTARLLGLEVTVIDPLPVPMSRVLNPEIGEWFVDLHRRHGVRSRFGVGVEGNKGERGDLLVQLTDGTVLEAATVNWRRALIECRRALQEGGNLGDVKIKIEALRNRPAVARAGS